MLQDLRAQVEANVKEASAQLKLVTEVTAQLERTKKAHGGARGRQEDFADRRRSEGPRCSVPR